MKKCNKCGLILPDEAKFCRNCGSNLSDPENFTQIEETENSGDSSANGQGAESSGVNGNLKSSKIVKKCNRCGNVVPEEVKLCKACGADMSDTSNYSFVKCPDQKATSDDNASDIHDHISVGSNSLETNRETTASKKKLPNCSKKKRKRHLKIVIPVLVAAAVCIFYAVLYYQQLNRTVTLSLNNYAGITYSGYNGYGEAKVNINSTKFYQDVYDVAVEKHKVKSRGDNPSAADIKSDLSQFFNVDDVLKYNVDENKKLSNGDAFTLTWKDSSDELSSLKIILDTSDLKTSVSGLTQANVIDPFDPSFFNVDTNTNGVHIIVSGTSPMLRIQIQDNLSGSPYSDIEYSVDTERSADSNDSYGYYANGDKVMIKASFSNGTGKEDDNVLLSTETEIEVQGDSQYVTDMSQITDSASLDQLRSDLKDYIESNLGTSGQKYNGWGTIYIYDNADESEHHSDVVIDSYEFVTEYLNTVKAGYFSKTNGVIADKYPSSNKYEKPYNCLTVIYKIHLHNDDGAYDAYRIISLPNMKVDKDGKLVYSAKDFYDFFQYESRDSADTVKAHHIDTLKSYYNIIEVNQNWDW